MKVVDASIATAWFLTEVGSARAHSLIASSETLISTSFVFLEVHYALSRALRRGNAEIVKLDHLETELRRCIATFHDILELAPAAMRLATQTGHPVYDCLYVVLAKREALTLVTLDQRQAEICRRQRVAFELL